MTPLRQALIRELQLKRRSEHTIQSYVIAVRQLADYYGRSPEELELVRKEIWTHILAYNLIRTIMAQAASQHEIRPREISFKGTVQTLEAFQPLISFQGHKGAAFRQQLYLQLLNAVATHPVADRPDRFEPRKRKRKPRTAEKMTKPRWEVKRLMRNGVTEI